MRTLLLSLAFTLAVSAADIGSVTEQRYISADRPMLVNLTDRIVPQVVTGGGWTTTFFLINLGTVDYQMNLDFYDDDGKRMQVSFPEHNVNGSSYLVSLKVGESVSAEMDDAPFGPTRQGWAILADPTAKISGYVILRQRVPGRPDFEALVPISPISDTRFTLGFDNRNRFSTGVAFANPTASNQPATAKLTFVDDRGRVLLEDSITLPPSGHTAFSVPDRYPATTGKYGLLKVTTEASRFSAMGLRFNPDGAFTSMHTLSTTQ